MCCIGTSMTSVFSWPSSSAICLSRAARTLTDSGRAAPGCSASSSYSPCKAARRFSFS